MKRVLTFSVDSPESVGSFLKRRLDVSTSLLKKIKLHPQGLLLNQKRVFTNQQMQTGDILTVLLEDGKAFSPNITALEGDLHIIYEDEDFLAVEKQAGLPVHPSKGHACDSLANLVTHYYQKQGQNFVFRCVNRLDKDTSGLVLIAKNAYCHDQMVKQMATGNFRKIYLAVAHGKLEAKTGSFRQNIRRIPDKATIKREICPEGCGDRAVTHYEVLLETGSLSLLKIRLETGRTHQIRVHFSAAGHPLAGDWLYGYDDGIPRQALHCHNLSFQHPLTGRALSFVSPLPEDIGRLLPKAPSI